MAGEIRVPTLGESVVEATVGSWRKREGEPVAVGEMLVELETEKVNTEVAADEAGVLEKIVHPEGDTVKPGDVLGTIASADGARAAQPTASAQPQSQPAPAAPSESQGQAVAAAPTATPAGVAGDGRDVRTPSEHEAPRPSSVAQRLASELGVDLARVPGTGPGGRVTREDVEALARARPSEPTPTTAAPPEAQAAAPVPAPVAAPPQAATPAAPVPTSGPPPATSAGAGGRPETRERLSRRRLTIARRLVEAQQTAAMLTTFNEVDLGAVMALRQRHREAFKQRFDVSLGYMGFFVRASVGALKRFPQVNAELQGEELVLKHYYDIGIAVGAEEGLVVPVLRDADRLTFAEIEQRIAGFVQKVRERTLSLDDLRGGTFTITNGGVYGSLLSTPILNPPQVGILGMHKIQERPVARDAQVVIRSMMYLALTYDHRVVDGQQAVQFLVAIKELLEDPERLLLEG